MLTLEVRRRPGAGAEMHRISGSTATVGASSGNEIVVRARGVYGRHLRLFERDGAYHVDLFKGIEAVNVNGRQFFGGAISPGDRIAIGEATITVVDAGPQSGLAAARPYSAGDDSGAAFDEAALAAASSPASAAPAAVPISSGLPVTEVEYRTLRLSAYRVCRQAATVEELATELTDFLDRELPPSEWAVGELASTGFRPLASTFRENPMLPPSMQQELRSGERLARSETVSSAVSRSPVTVSHGCEANARIRRTPGSLRSRRMRSSSSSPPPAKPVGSSPHLPISRPRKAFCSDSWKVRPIAITSPTDFICVVRRFSVAGNFSKANRGILVTM